MHTRTGQSIAYQRDRHGLCAIVFDDGCAIDVQSQKGRITRISFKDRLLAAYAYNDKGELTKVYDPLDKPCCFAYENGRRVQRYFAPGDSFNYGWDNAGRLTGISRLVFKVVRMGYDALGRRGYKGGWGARYNPIGDIDKLFVNQFENLIRLQGQYEDRETGLHDNRHRYYAPIPGQFLSQDPLGLAAGENLDSFGPNMWGWVDPLGLACKQSNSGSEDKFYRYVGEGEAEVIRRTGKVPNVDRELNPKATMRKRH